LCCTSLMLARLVGFGVIMRDGENRSEKVVSELIGDLLI